MTRVIRPKPKRLLQTLVAVGFLISFLSLPGAENASVRTALAKDPAPLAITEKEFRALAAELAPKVNLFQETWKIDPDAEFYGGTTRDYLFWLKGKFLGITQRKDALAVIQKLKKEPVIDVREFIVGESDVDIVSDSTKLPEAANFAVRKIDALSKEIFDPKTELGRNEIDQGYIPAEKVRLARDGFKPTPLGDGVKEIYSGKLSVQFPDPEAFKRTRYAREGVNHTILLAIRYLRLQAVNYFHTHGRDYPNTKLLFDAMDERSRAEVKKTIESVMDGQALVPYMKSKRFVSWLNGSIQKAFRSYTNPTAALHLMREFGVEKLSELYPEIDPIHQYVFSKYRDEAAIRKMMNEHQVDAEKFFQSPSKFFEDGHLYHGTKKEEWFRSILFQGVLPSEDGTAGPGLYGVSKGHIGFAEDWAKDKRRVLRFPVSSQAKIVDITQGEGKKIWDATETLHKGQFEEFADLFGIDLLKYEYGDVDAFVVENASVLGRADGVHRRMLPVPELLKTLQGEKDAWRVIDLLSVNSPTRDEVDRAWKASAVNKDQIVKAIRAKERPDDLLKYVLGSNFLAEDAEINNAFLKWNVLEPEVSKAILEAGSSLSGGSRLVEQAFLSSDVGTRYNLEDLLGLLTRLGHRSERVNEKIVNLYSSKASKNRGLSIEMNRYIAGSKFSEEHQKKLLKPFLDSAELNLGFADTLLSGGAVKKQVRAYLESYAGDPDSKYERYQAKDVRALLMAHFPADPKLEKEAIAVLAKQIAKGELDSGTLRMMRQLSTRLEEARKMLIDFIPTVDLGRYSLIHDLLQLDPTRDELSKLIQDPKILQTGSAFDLLMDWLWPPDKEVLRSVVQSYLETTPSRRASYQNRKQMLEFLGDLPEDEDRLMLDVLSEKLKTEPWQSQKISDLLAARKHPLPDLDASCVLRKLTAALSQ